MLPYFLDAIGNLLCSTQCQHNVEETTPNTIISPSSYLSLQLISMLWYPECLRDKGKVEGCQLGLVCEAPRPREMVDFLLWFEVNDCSKKVFHTSTWLLVLHGAAGICLPHIPFKFRVRNWQNSLTLHINACQNIYTYPGYQNIQHHIQSKHQQLSSYQHPFSHTVKCF